MSGYYVMTWGGGRWTSVAWYAKREEATAEVERRIKNGSWAGEPPRVEPGRG